MHSEKGDDGLELRRKGREWLLYYLRKHTRRKPFPDGLDPFTGLEEVWESVPLAEASLRVKARAVHLFGSFLEGLAEEYRRTRSAVLEANREFEQIDQVLERINSSKQEGA
jgi:hypothetical protein